MPRKIAIAAAFLFAASFLLLLLPAGIAVSQDLTRVFVTNFPDTQRVEGRVTVEGPIRHAVLTSMKDITVSPVSPHDTTRLIEGGTLVTDGFPYAVLSLAGQVKGELVRPGSVGAFLIPDEEPILRAFAEEGLMLFTFEVTAAGVSSASPYFASNQPRFTVAFPRYRVLFYNTTAKAVSVNLYAYLAGS